MGRGERGFDMFDDFDVLDSVARTSDPHTSHEALSDDKKSKRVADTITRLALEAGERGLTINEAAAIMPEHKPWSVSPKFKPLVRRGKLVRNVVGRTEPTKRHPEGRAKFETRPDPETGCDCIVHYHHTVLAPKKKPGSVAPLPGEAVSRG
jgi:hypothetical protein